MGNDLTAPLEEMACALIARDALRLRELLLEWRRAAGNPSLLPPPRSQDARVRIAAAALAELLAERDDVPAPSWTGREGSFAEPFFALASAGRLQSLRELCRREAPAALRRHGILAPSNFLELL